MKMVLESELKIRIVRSLQTLADTIRELYPDQEFVVMYDIENKLAEANEMVYQLTKGE
jgi:hypothetical protein